MRFLNRNPQRGPHGLSRLYSCESIKEFRGLSPLPEDAQRQIDAAVTRVGRQRLVIVEDLLAEGLTYPLNDWLSVTELAWDKVSEVGHAQRTMVPKARGERQVQDRLRNVLPIYCTWDDFSFNVREMRASERVNAPLDTSHVEQATRRVNEAFEDQAINGIDFNVVGNTAPGILTEDNVNTQAYVGNEAWDNVGHTGDEIYGDVSAMIDKLQAKNYYGPYNLYIPTLYGSKLNQDFKANGDKTIRQRLEEIEAGGRNLRIRVADQLPANRTALIQMTNNVIDVVVGQTPAEVSWEDGAGWERFFVILGCMIVRVKSDYEGKSGIVIGNTT